MPIVRCQRWDVFCRVVDNFGDAGVCWRLARQLANEHGRDVTLYIDDAAALARLAPGAIVGQRCAGVVVRAWTDAADAAPAAAVVEGFGGGLPDAYVQAMAGTSPAPRWFVLEYLSAERWVETRHGLPSPHPQTGLARRFWFPGFTAATGGLLREQGLAAARDAFVADATARRALWETLGVPPPQPGILRLSLFCYPNPALPALAAAWRTGTTAIECVVCGGESGPELTAERPAGALRVLRVPFVDQRDYDRLLWDCDVNFVRGEDSFVRAQWAARPMVWHAYPQPERAERPKLAAFVDRYAAGLPTSAAAATGALFAAWNALPGAPAIGAAWDAFVTQRAAIAAHARRWATELGRQTDLATGLVRAAEADV